MAKLSNFGLVKLFYGFDDKTTFNHLSNEVDTKLVEAVIEFTLRHMYDADNGYFMVSTGGEVINQDGSENWLLVYDLDGSASGGETFIGRLLQSEDVWAVGVSSDSVVDVLVDGAVSLSTDSSSDISAKLEEARKLVNSVKDSNVSMAAVEAKINSFA